MELVPRIYDALCQQPGEKIDVKTDPFRALSESPDGPGREEGLKQPSPERVASFEQALRPTCLRCLFRSRLIRGSRNGYFNPFRSW